MLAIDTETTGLWWQHGCTTFAIGWYSREGSGHCLKEIDPHTRHRRSSFTPNECRNIRKMMQDEEIVIFQNARYDIKALCEAGVFTWDEPLNPAFWTNIYDLSHFVHIYDSTECRGKGLKQWSAWLGENYEEVDDLDRIVQRCRTFVSNRNSDWLTASSSTVPQARPTGSKWHKMDMWLPAAIYDHWDDHEEVEAYFSPTKTNSHNDYPNLPIILTRYLDKDCECTWELAASLTGQLIERHGAEKFTHLLEMNHSLQHVLWSMEIQGISINMNYMDEALAACDRWLEKTHDVCQDLSGIRSKGSYTPEKLKTILYEDFSLKPTAFTPSGMPTTKANELQKLKDSLDPEEHSTASQFLTSYLAHQKYDTKKSYLQGYRRVSLPGNELPYRGDLSNSEDYRESSWWIFPSFNESGTGTTRLSSQDPNAQNIEKAGSPFADQEIQGLLLESPSLRSVFGPPEGKWWFPIDYAQLQLRIFAAATRDPALIQAFRDGKDFHDFMAHVIFDLLESQEPDTAQRRVAKNVNFGFIFGAGEKKIDATAQRRGLYRYLMQCFPNAKEFLEETKELIQETGVIHTLGGYPLHIPLRVSPWGTMSYAAHMGVNYIVQGTEGEIVRRAMLLTHNYLRQEYPEGRLVLQVHDELVFETPARPPKAHLRKLCSLMEQAGRHYGVETPVDAELCLHNFAEKKSFSLN